MSTTNNPFYSILKEWDQQRIEHYINSVSLTHVEKALYTADSGKQLSIEEFLCLLSPYAFTLIEEMACIAQRYTKQHFGKTIQLFAPLYISNFCVNTCNYCSFNAKNAIPRIQLSIQEIVNEATALASTGLRHILLLTGDAPAKAHIAYLSEVVRTLRPIFQSLEVEIYAATEEEYSTLYASGVDSMTLFQETYNEQRYALFHPSGPKKDFIFRLGAHIRAAQAGIPFVTLGSLLGLDHWWKDTFYTGLHAAWLQQNYPQTGLSISLPRIRPYKGESATLYPVSDKNLFQAFQALRIFLPTVGLVLSTRECSQFRDHLIPLSITKMSAGVSTSVGGYAKPPKEKTSQFEISDERSVEQVVQAIKNKGYQPIFQNWLNIRSTETM